MKMKISERSIVSENNGVNADKGGFRTTSEDGGGTSVKVDKDSLTFKFSTTERGHHRDEIYKF
jgi:hypothetical protein